MNLITSISILHFLTAVSGWTAPIEEQGFHLYENTQISSEVKVKVSHTVQNIQTNIYGKLPSPIKCGGCSKTVGDYSDAFSLQNRKKRSAFVNPYGYSHDVLTLSRMRNFVTHGQPTTEATWFKGYSWMIITCDKCGRHLGWEYRAVEKKLKPQTFWGLTMSSVHQKKTNKNNNSTNFTKFLQIFNI